MVPFAFELFKHTQREKMVHSLIVNIIMKQSVAVTLLQRESRRCHRIIQTKIFGKGLCERCLSGSQIAPKYDNAAFGQQIGNSLTNILQLFKGAL